MTQELRRLAEAVINDEWRHVPADDCHGHYIETYGSAETICDLYFTTNKRHDFRNAEKNAAYIAAANPAAILALIDRLEKAEKALKVAANALSLALSDVDWRKDSPTQPVIHKAYQKAMEASK